ncbi:DEAD/DEAH box helicase [Paenibacillus sp. IB182496]|uniref:DEAD/DEAH box helicase n=1 Tax=Paenibacillus sabuli TaxID=2772509 RepID=A0A927BTZ8_9BACL|nr:DEAD/DEAH box helicase [Paenibacillus sabuli]MBD2846777.1 DEAD/DEAH box helicase [Paenibacillus sabuli]
MTLSFEQLGVGPELTGRLKSLGIALPTPVQEQTIPAAAAGRDVIVQAQTGTGKTLAFALPILERLRAEREHIQALIVTPTRELAIQITQELDKLADLFGASVLAAYGGQDVDAQIRKLQGAAHIVVATPGRLLDHLRRGTIELWKLDTVVLDEADQMLHMGFLPEVEEILAQTPRQRQTMLFSATIPEPIRQLAAHYLREPEDIRVRGQAVTLRSIRQYLVPATDRTRLPLLQQLIEEDRPYLAVVFCRTKLRAKKLCASLQETGLAADELHGDLTQAKREQVMKRFRSAKLQVLVATDVAARGLDVEGVTHVYNYDVPQDAEIYIHRIGRTGRAGQEGCAVTLASARDRYAVQAIERGIGEPLRPRSAPGSTESTAPNVPGEKRPQDREQGVRSRGREAGRSGGRGAGHTGRHDAGRTGGRDADRTRESVGGRTRGRDVERIGKHDAGRTGGRDAERARGRESDRADRQESDWTHGRGSDRARRSAANGAQGAARSRNSEGKRGQAGYGTAPGGKPARGGKAQSGRPSRDKASPAGRSAGKRGAGTAGGRRGAGRPGAAPTGRRRER